METPSVTPLSKDNSCRYDIQNICCKNYKTNIMLKIETEKYNCIIETQLMRLSTMKT